MKAQRTYEDSVRAADGQQRQALKAAQDEYLTKLKEAKDSALEANDLKAANEIEAARKVIAKKRPALAPTFQLAIEAQRVHEDSVQAANDQHLDDLKKAEEVYLQEMQVGLDAAIAAKDLTEANRIDAAMHEMQQKIETRDTTGKLVFSTTTNSIGMKFVVIPAGEFVMGSPPSEAGREEGETQHRVTLTQPFEMGIHEVTQAQYEQVAGSNPSRFKGANHPVDSVSSDDAAGFCRILSALPAEEAAGRSYRLPTEAEWEYACRAGTTTAFSFGDDERQSGRYAWFDQNSRPSTHPVGQLLPNAWGLHDMHGNVWEWCFDWHAPPTAEAVSDPQGPQSGTERVLRGGSFVFPASLARSAYRTGTGPTAISHNHGFRVVVSQVNE